MCKKNKKKGFSLVELVVTVSILSVLAVIGIASYTSVLEDQRKKTDMQMLNNIDTQLHQVLLYDDAFEDVKDNVYDKNKLSLTFHVVTEDNKGTVYLSETTINGNDQLLNETCVTLYNYLREYVGEKIQLTSSGYREGWYTVLCEFDGTQVSDVRDYSIINDNTIITNQYDLHK